MRALSPRIYKTSSWRNTVKQSGLASNLSTICAPDTRLERSRDYIARSFRKYVWKEAFSEMLDKWTPPDAFEDSDVRNFTM